MFGRRIGEAPSAAPAQDGSAWRAPSPFDVLIRHDGGAVVDGQPLPVPEGESVHGAVLDLMHRHAQARGGPVEAVILDRQRDDVTVVEIAPDGSSRIVLHEELDATAGVQPRPAVARSPADAAPDGPRPGTGLPAVPESEVLRPRVPGPAVPDSPAPDSATAGVRPADTAHPADEGTPDAEAVPDELGELVAVVCRSVDTGAVERAAALAFRLREHTTRAFGPEHRHTLQAHALEAFVAHRGGNPLLATSMCLELARIRHRQGDPGAREELTRATAAWLRADDVPSAVEHGRTLLALWSAWTDDGGSKVADATLPRLVNRRMRALAEGAGTRMTGVA